MMLQDKLKNSNLISSDRVEGTAVYGSNKEKIGSVDKLLIQKRGGQVTDAIISVGGFLGIGDEKNSVPWAMLDYDTELEGYRLDVTKEQLQAAPRFGSDEEDRAYDRDYQSTVYQYWAVSPHW